MSLAFLKIEIQISVSWNVPKKYIVFKMSDVWTASGIAHYESFVTEIFQIAAIIVQTEFILNMKNITFRRRRVSEILQSQPHIFVHTFMNISRWLVDSTIMKHNTNGSFTQRSNMENSSGTLLIIPYFLSTCFTNC